MRPIKFRVWLDEFNKMFYDVGLMGGELYVNIDGKGYDVVGDCRDFKLMQFTGLKDRNGREIYEGDVLKNDYGDLWVVVWKGTGFMLALNGESKNIYSANEYYFSSCEVIGNIYENHELLEGEK